MKTIHHVFEIAASKDDVYAALTTGEGLASWWTTRVDARAEVGATIDFTFGEDFNPDMRVTELLPGEVVAWTCVGGHEPWADNDFRFELERSGTGTRVRFWQHYARELSDDAYGTYNYNWGYYLESLRLHCETGEGKPFGMSDEAANKPVAMRLADEVFSGGDMEALEEIVADDYTNHNIPVPGIPGTKDGFRQLVTATRTAFPDVKVHVDDLVAERDLVVFHDHVTATSKGDFLGVPPNGERISWTEIHFLRVADGRIVEHWTNFDQLGILQQLGAIPAGP